MTRFRTAIGFLCLAVTIVDGARAARGGPSISQVDIDTARARIVIAGRGFGDGEGLRITLGEIGDISPLCSLDATIADRITCDFSTVGGLPPAGGYLLTVAAADGSGRSDRFDLTLAPVRPQDTQRHPRGPVGASAPGGAVVPTAPRPSGPGGPKGPPPPPPPALTSIVGRFGGDGRDGAKDIPHQKSEPLGGPKQYSSLTVTGEWILEDAFNYIAVSGRCTIGGTIRVDGRGRLGGLGSLGGGATGEGATFPRDVAGAGGGGGGHQMVVYNPPGSYDCGTGHGSIPWDGWDWGFSQPGGSGGGAGAAGGNGSATGVGVPGQETPASEIFLATQGVSRSGTGNTRIDAFGPLLYHVGAGGGAGGGGLVITQFGPCPNRAPSGSGCIGTPDPSCSWPIAWTNYPGGNGGNGGGVLYLECGELELARGATLSARGGDGGAASSGNAGGGGGGGGGVVLVRTRTILSAQGAVWVKGGTGGAGAGTGTPGGDGADGFRDVVDVDGP